MKLAPLFWGESRCGPGHISSGAIAQFTGRLVNGVSLSRIRDVLPDEMDFEERMLTDALPFFGTLQFATAKQKFHKLIWKLDHIGTLQ